MAPTWNLSNVYGKLFLQISGWITVCYRTHFTIQILPYTISLLITACSWIAMAQNEQEMPWPTQQQLAHNSCWGRHSFHRLLFLFFLVFSPHDMNVFVTDLIVDNVVTQVQGFSSGILIIWETVWDMNKFWLTCGSHAQLTCSILCEGF